MLDFVYVRNCNEKGIPCYILIGPHFLTILDSSEIVQLKSLQYYSPVNAMALYCMVQILPTTPLPHRHAFVPFFSIFMKTLSFVLANILCVISQTLDKPDEPETCISSFWVQCVQTGYLNIQSFIPFQFCIWRCSILNLTQY